MLGKVKRMESSYNNKSTVATSPLLSRVKLLYYMIFASAYGTAGW